MTTTTEAVRADARAEAEKSAPNFRKLTKAQLLRRLEFAQYMMNHMGNYYRECAVRWPGDDRYTNRDRVCAEAMDMALEFISEDPERKYRA